MYFLTHKVTRDEFTKEVLTTFSLLDDYDVVSAMKEWQYHNDVVLAKLCTMLLNRDLLKIKLKKQPINQEKVSQKKEEIAKEMDIPYDLAVISFFLVKYKIRHTIKKNKISIF